MRGEAAFAWMTRLKAVEREYNTTRMGMDRFHQQAAADPGILGGDLRPRDILAVLDRLEGTYLVRLFSEFETALRHFLRFMKLRQPNSTETLVNKVRDRVGIPHEFAADVHMVRDYRNTLVHDVERSAEPVTVRDATRACSTFLSWLQRSW